MVFRIGSALVSGYTSTSFRLARAVFSFDADVVFSNLI